MEPFQIEANVQGVQNLTESWFMKYPWNASYNKVELAEIKPQLNYDPKGGPIHFEFQQLPFPYAYQINQLMMEVNIKITKSDGVTLPEKNLTITPINNIINSMFSNVDIIINKKVR